MVQDIEAEIKLAENAGSLEEITVSYQDTLDAMKADSPTHYERVMRCMESRYEELDRPAVAELHPAAMP